MSDNQEQQQQLQHQQTLSSQQQTQQQLQQQQQQQDQQQDQQQQSDQQQQQQQQPNSHDLQQQQQQLQTSATTTTSSIATANNNNINNHNTTPTTVAPVAPRPITEDLFSTKRWGTTPVRQDTPWDLPPSPTSNPSTGPIAPVGGGGSIHSPATTIAASLSNNQNINAGGNLGGGGANAVAMMATAANSSAAAAASNAAALASHAAAAAAAAIVGGGNGANDGFARAPPGPPSSIMDNNLTSKPFGLANRSSTWSAFGNPVVGPNEPDSDNSWPKSTNTTNSGISVGNSTQQQQQQQQSSVFDLVPEFEPGKSWHGSMLMKSLDDDSSINSNSAGIAAFAGAFATSSKSPTGSQYEPSGIGTWSPVVKGGRLGSKWDGDGPDNGRGDNGRFDDGTAIWGSPAQKKVVGVDWVDKSGDANINNDKSRSMTGNNQSYRPKQSSSSTSLLMSSNTSPSSQHSRNQQTFKQPLLSHSFDQVQQQSNALSSQPNQPNRASGLSNVPSTQQLKHMVQQIQLAVQAGHLNPQILNQPLAPVTLQLLYQLLQQIKILQQLQMTASQQFNKPGSHPASTVNVHITKTKQGILNLQNQIAAQQAVYLKSTQAHNISTRQPIMPNLATGGMGGGIGPALPPGISQSGDSFRSGTSVNDFAHGQTMVNNFGVDSMNGLANSLGHMNLGGGAMHSSRFDQPWRAPAAKQHQQPPMASSSPFANHNLMNHGVPGMQKSMLNSSGNGGSSYGGMQQQGGNEGFVRAPGPATSIMDNNMTSKPFGMANRSSTWSAFGTSAPNEADSEWPKTTTSGFSMGNSTQPSNAFDLVPEFEPGKPWRGSMLMKSVEDDPTMTPGSMARSLAPQRKTIWSDEVL